MKKNVFVSSMKRCACGVLFTHPESDECGQCRKAVYACGHPRRPGDTAHTCGRVLCSIGSATPAPVLTIQSRKARRG